jgi:cation transport ATPase
MAVLVAVDGPRCGCVALADAARETSAAVVALHDAMLEARH